MTIEKRPERRNQADRRAEAESRMLAAAMELVAQKGLSAVSLTDVGKAAGYSRGLASHYFDTRDHLLTALTDQVMRGFVARAEARTLDLPPVETLTRMINNYFADVVADPIGWRVFLELLHEGLVNPTVAQGLTPLHVGAINRLERLVQAGIASGDFRADMDPRIEATVMLATLRGLAGLMVTYPDNQDFRNATRAVGVSLINGLQGRQPRAQNAGAA